MATPFVKAHLLQRYQISFPGTGKNSATVSFVPQREHVTHADNSQDSWNFCNELRWYLSPDNLGETEYGNGQLNCTFILSTYKRDSTRVTIQLGGPLIKWLVDKAGHGLKIEVNVSDFGYANLTWSGPANKRKFTFLTNTADMRPSYPREENNHPVYEDSFGLTPRAWLVDPTGNWSQYHEYHLTMNIEMFGNVKDEIVQQPQLKNSADPWTQLRNEEIKQLLTNQENADMEILSSEGSKFPCHKIIVIGKSTKLRQKLQNPEGRQFPTLLMEKSAASVSAFLACRYAVDVEDALQDCATCIDVLKITQEFELLATQQQVKKILMTKEADFTAGNCLELYCFANGNPNHKDLEEMALYRMKMKYQELVFCAEFEQLHKQDRKLYGEMLIALESMSSVLTEANYLPD